MTRQIDTLRRFLARQAPVTGAAGGGPVLMGSGKGGTGVSTIAALTALVAAGEGRRTLLIDANEGLGTLHMLLGADPGAGLGALRGGVASPEQLAVPVTEDLELITLDGGQAVSAAERDVLFRRLSGVYARYDLVVIDGGSRLDGVLRAASAGAGRLLLLSAPDRVSLAATHALIKAAAVKAPAAAPMVAFNQCTEAEARAAFDVLRAGARQFLSRDIEFAGAVPEDAHFRAASRAGTALADAGASSSLLPHVRDLEAILTESPLPQARAIPLATR